MHILQCRHCRQHFLDLGNTKDPERAKWFAEHGTHCTATPLPAMRPEQNEAALRMLVYADTTTSH